MVSALLLTGLFFRLGIEQRKREIGILRSLGFSASKIRTVFLLEGAALAVAGAAVGVGVALAYGALILLGLRTWWFDAVGTRLLSLHTSAAAAGRRGNRRCGSGPGLGGMDLARTSAGNSPGSAGGRAEDRDRTLALVRRSHRGDPGGGAGGRGCGRPARSRPPDSSAPARCC